MVSNEKFKIVVFDFLTLQPLCTFEEHKFILDSIKIIEEIQMVFSNCKSGQLFFWQIKSNQQIYKNYKFDPNEEDNQQLVYNHNHEIPYLSYDYDYQLDLFVGCTKESSILMYRNYCREKVFQMSHQDQIYTSLLINKKQGLLFCGNNKGQLIVYRWPLNYVYEKGVVREAPQLFKMLDIMIEPLNFIV